MLRIRRSRAVLVAIFCTIGLYQIWRTQSIDRITEFRHHDHVKPKAETSSTTSATSLTSIEVAQLPTPSPSPSEPVPRSLTSSPALDHSTVTSSTEQSLQSTSSTPVIPPSNEADRIKHGDDVSDSFEAIGQGRLEIDKESAALEQSRWQRQKEHFPVPSESLLQLPSGRPKKIPTIQHKFRTESADQKKQNEERQETIQKAFQHSWKGYEEFAWGHDEISPVSQDYKDPFNGWAATLIDSLDTLWIMGLKEEFDRAVNKVKEIDFHTSPRKDIPLFETTIRYLGGLLGAYDISEAKYPVLLEKAQKLAEVLITAADTPNRMPILYLFWSPSYASQAHRAPSRAALAELGSLSVEFTRLAMLTKETKYYDMIARITNELEAWQNNTRLPGLWPIHIDTSGCKKSDSTQIAHSASNGPQANLPPTRPNGFGHGDLDDTLPEKKEEAGSSPSNGDRLKRRQLDDAVFSKGNHSSNVNQTSPNSSSQNARSPNTDVDCQPQGLASPSYSSRESFAVGGMADSTYEYLPKQHLLLGGLEENYEKMYRRAAKVIRDKLLYRPMTETRSDILFAAVAHVTPHADLPVTFDYEGSHLACFLGGMFALGSRLFEGLADDLEIARKLTNGCIWAYNSTKTGIMPEQFSLMPCPDTDCVWNETAWHAALDPDREDREEGAKTWYEYQKILAGNSRKETEEAQAEPKSNLEPMPVLPAGDNPATGSGKQNKKRDANPADPAEPAKQPEAIPPPATTIPTGTVPEFSFSDKDNAHSTDLPDLPSTMRPHAEYVRNRIREEHLSPGFTKIDSPRYILRPEAIESVFIMYRLTGEPEWRDQGWRMFQSIQKHTETEHANSAISDVNSDFPQFLDSMESFWHAETLKYFYLLFADPGVVSLDEWVLNTEAHPFRLNSETSS